MTKGIHMTKTEQEKAAITALLDGTLGDYAGTAREVMSVH